MRYLPGHQTSKQLLLLKNRQKIWLQNWIRTIGTLTLRNQNAQLQPITVVNHPLKHALTPFTIYNDINEPAVEWGKWKYNRSVEISEPDQIIRSFPSISCKVSSLVQMVFNLSLIDLLRSLLCLEHCLCMLALLFNTQMISRSTLDHHLDRSLVDTRSTVDRHLDWHPMDTWSWQMLVDIWPSVDWLTELIDNL